MSIPLPNLDDRRWQGGPSAWQTVRGTLVGLSESGRLGWWLLALALIDLRSWRLPDALTLPLTAMALGAFAIVALPREEEPQIIVPMVDVMVQMPGASAADVEQRVTRPMEQLLWEIPGVEYLYSTSSPGQSMVIVRFLVGEDEERADRVAAVLGEQVRLDRLAADE